MHRSGWRAGRVSGRTTAAVALVACAALVGCTRTSDLSANVEATTTTARVPVRQVPRPTTSTTSPTTTAPADRSATTTSRPAADGSAARRATATTQPPLAALVAALQAAGAIRGAATTLPAPPPTTSTTMIPANPAGVVVTARNAVVHQGESQTITVAAAGDDTAPPLVACDGHDYRPSGTGFVSAGFTSATTCTGGATPTLVRTLPANVPTGQYVFCTEVASAAGPTSVCTAYVVVAYPT
jgi:hypothetical protein